ncbi:aldehyde dehydrogenase EutE [Tepidanaerobacter sp. GT38]|uniref:aldehyde dehydrogenase family protein n=1 Tax=Tepidanaerobacter sp. GT38 TaxID=2722793 RepID=UPI001F3D5431|nr:aldehyde dehydrogenase family protein [Tepidanaerobacter sp. GT38]MCG1013012.1 aldehyde dehydrogenase EutE [Tepidanaerobacter sp. GT38]
MIQEELISLIKNKIIDELSKANGPDESELGIFNTVDEAVCAAKEAQRRLNMLDLEKREIIISAIREVSINNANYLAALCVEESQMGRVDDKIAKIILAAKKTPGTEDLTPWAKSGDHGLTLVERGPFGVLAAITPVTNPVSTIVNNSIGMIAGGNTVVVNPHPRAVKVSIETIKLINDAIAKAGGPRHLICTVKEPTIQTSQQLMQHPDIKMIVATGGPGVVKAALSSGKKAIGAGAGNPPAVVDETADIAKAAHDIVLGASFDNNLPCIAEKVVIVVEKVAKQLMDSFKNENVYILNDEESDAITKKIVLNGAVNKDLVGRDASYILSQIKAGPIPDVRLLIMPTDKNHPLVYLEQLMPVLPVVTVSDVDEAIELAVKCEHGNRHTAIMHSKNVDNMTKYARAIETTIFVKNGPSYAGIGMGGEGFTTFTIAGPTGEGLTSAKTFTRQRRCILVDGFRIV